MVSLQFGVQVLCGGESVVPVPGEFLIMRLLVSETVPYTRRATLLTSTF